MWGITFFNFFINIYAIIEYPLHFNTTKLCYCYQYGVTVDRIKVMNIDIQNASGHFFQNFEKF